MLAFQLVNLVHNLRFVDYTVGHTGSTHDATAFRKMQISKDQTRGIFLGDEQWVWADSAYPVTEWCIPPFKRPAHGSLTSSQTTFNYHLSTVWLFYSLIPS